MNWRDLAAELDHWQDSGRTATWWWRDDDAAARSPGLDRLLALSARRQIPLALAVVPEHVEDELAAAVSTASARVLQHGCRHVNRAEPPAKKCELIADPAVEAGLASGLARLAGLFGAAALPVLVPPWNRIDHALVPRLASLGYRGLSRFKPRTGKTVAGLLQVNTHIDIMAWRSGGGFHGEPEVLGAAVEHLRARRLGGVDPDEPTGLLTHHLEHDEACWAFIDRLIDQTRRHPAVQWLEVGEVFAA